MQLGLAAPTGTSLDLQLPAGTLVTTLLGDRTTSSGVGDLEARVRQSLSRWLGGPVLIGAALGLAAPTGEYVARSGAANLPPEASYLTLGRGATWALADLDARVRAGTATNLFAQVAARAPLGRTRDEFDWGTELRATVAAQVRIGRGVSLLASTDVQWRGGATEPDPFGGGRLMSANAGGWQWAVSPAAALALPRGVSIIAGARIPLLNDVVGNQLVPQPGGFLAVSYAHAITRPVRAVTEVSADRGPFQPTPGRITVVDYWATWCKPCAQITRALEAAAPRWGADVHIVKIDATAWPGDAAPALPAGAEGLPAVEIFDATGARHVLLLGEDALRSVDEVERLRATATQSRK